MTCDWHFNFGSGLLSLKGKRLRRCYWEPKRVNPADEGYGPNAGSSWPDRAEAMATGDSSSILGSGLANVNLRRCWVGRNGPTWFEWLPWKISDFNKNWSWWEARWPVWIAKPSSWTSSTRCHAGYGRWSRGSNSNWWIGSTGGGASGAKGSVLQAAERVGLSLLGIAGVVTDKGTCGGGGSNVKSNLLHLFDGATSTGYIYNFGKGGGSKCTLLSMSQGLMWWEEDQRWNKLPLEADCLVVVVCHVACRRHRGEEVAL